MKLLTRKQMATVLVEDQIKRGIIKEDNKEFQINCRLKGPLQMSWGDLCDYCEEYKLIKSRFEI